MRRLTSHSNLRGVAHEASPYLSTITRRVILRAIEKLGSDATARNLAFLIPAATGRFEWLAKWDDTGHNVGASGGLYTTLNSMMEAGLVLRRSEAGHRKVYVYAVSVRGTKALANTEKCVSAVSHPTRVRSAG